MKEIVPIASDRGGTLREEVTARAARPEPSSPSQGVTLDQNPAQRSSRVRHAPPRRLLPRFDRRPGAIEAGTAARPRRARLPRRRAAGLPRPRSLGPPQLDLRPP